MTVRPRATLLSRIGGWLQDRGIVLRLSLAIGSIALLMLVLQTWEAPFPYRLGVYANHGIAAKTDFDRIDPDDTERARDRAEEAIPLIFRNHPEVLATLPEQFRAALGEIARADALDSLPMATRVEFGMAASPPADPRRTEARKLFGTEPPETRFAALREAVVGPDMNMAKDRIDDLVADFTRFISPLQQTGILDPVDEAKPGVRADSKIVVVSESGVESSELLVPRVRLSDQLTEAGDLGSKWLSYPSLAKPIQAAVSYWLIAQAKPTLVFDQAATKTAQSKARDAVPDVHKRYTKGDLIVRPGESIDALKLSILEDEFSAAEKAIGIPARLARMSAVFFMMLVLAALNGYYIIHNEPRIVRSVGRFCVFLGAIVVAAALARPLSYDPWRAEIIPLLMTVMVLAVAYNQVLATLTAFSICLALTFATTAQFGQFVVLISTCAAGVIPLSRVGTRSTLIKVSVFAGLTYFVVNLGVGVVQAQSLAEVMQNNAVLMQSLKGAVWSVLAGYFVAGSLPFIESLFGVVTDISLLEVSDPSHPLLQELVRRAPGTYNHSISVASIGEAAAEAIDANGLLVRVGAYFHDIGKMLKPQYFIENIQAGTESRHENLAPAMSTLIIIGHVKDGVDLAEEHNLPRPLIDFIEQHHGTTLVEYFYHEATKLAEAKPDHKTDAEESSFRYPGPKPQTREAGVLMLSDAVEGASRTLSDPTPKRIETLVHNITIKRLLDGQFDECSLKLSEIRTIEASLVKSLIGIYHGRIRYPEARTA
jgi:putative nucleotidyltransferase with HDIG domain